MDKDIETKEIQIYMLKLKRQNYKDKAKKEGVPDARLCSTQVLRRDDASRRPDLVRQRLRMLLVRSRDDITLKPCEAMHRMQARWDSP